MKSLKKKSAKTFLYEYHAFNKRRAYKKLLRINGIADKPVTGEKEWMEKWSVLGNTSPVYFRLFSHYIGPDMNIVPDDIGLDVIEPILNPYRYRKYYADKNMFDRIFPEGYLVKTFLRKMNGFYYDSHYQRIEMDDDKLYKILEEANVGKIIVKPTVDGMSGVGIKCFVKDEAGSWHLYNNPERKAKQSIGGKNTLLSFSFLENNCGKDFAIQEFLEQYEYINQFCSTSVNTLRLTLYRSVVSSQKKAID